MTKRIFLRTAGFARRWAFGWGFLEGAKFEGAKHHTSSKAVKCNSKGLQWLAEPVYCVTPGFESGVEVVASQATPGHREIGRLRSISCDRIRL
jgi:hypothetical protein